MLDAGWHRATVVELAIRFIGAKGTPLLEIEMLEVEGDKTATNKLWLTEKCHNRVARFIRDCGISDEDRDAMDSDVPETLEGLLDCTLWILVDWVKNDKDKKFYREVVDFRLDGDKPTSTPKYAENPGQRTQAAVDEESDIPFGEDEDDVF